LSENFLKSRFSHFSGRIEHDFGRIEHDFGAHRAI
ncbi:hypothetical protein T11_10745, partial [Trichinella zimbabwensis]